MAEKRAIHYEYFPTVWQAVIWRNWGYIPAERLAKVLSTDEKTIRLEAKRLGLDPNLSVNPMWEKRGYLTTIRENWHLCTNEQIMEMLQLSEEEFQFILKEDDFMWVKLGELKPVVSEPQYATLTVEECMQTEKIAAFIRSSGMEKIRDNAFAFVHEFQMPVSDTEAEIVHSENLRMVYPYFALYGDALSDDSVDPIPERLLMEYAKVGINGIWMQMVLYQMVEFPFDPSLSKGWKKRIASLNRLVAKAKKYGIGIYPYLNEPRAMGKDFFEKYPHLRGEKEGNYYAMCTSTKEVQDYLYGGVRRLFEMVPDLAGFFTITMSENLTNCYSRLKGEMTCPRCRERAPWEVVAEVNNLMAKGAHDANPGAKVISWAWAWQDAWEEKVIPLLTEGQILQSTSEEGMEYCIGGVNGRIIDYSMSLCGPGNKAKKMWQAARKQGLQISAKVQINNTWELASIPYIPVFSKLEQHIEQLKAEGIRHLHAGWSLGGCPSPNLRLAAWLMDGTGNLKEFLENWLGKETAEGVYQAQKVMSDAFSHYPFHVSTVYYGPQNFGPMAPFFLKKTGYEATMIGFPYDDLEKWEGNYPPDIYEAEYCKLVKGWQDGVKKIQAYEGLYKELDEVILMAEAALCHFESALHHIQFVRRRDMNQKGELPAIVREEMQTVQHLIKLREKDSRIGYESSTHYFYTLQDLKEKMIHLAFCEERLRELCGY